MQRESPKLSSIEDLHEHDPHVTTMNAGNPASFEVSRNEYFYL